jgi:hypothetical protein
MSRLKKLTPGQLADALESGKYKKGHTQLRTDDRDKRRKPAFCCLGVACEVVGAKYEGDMAYLFDDENGEVRRLVQGVKVHPSDWIPTDGAAPYWAPWLTRSLQENLAVTNDNASTFEPVIKYLRQLEGSS